MPANKRQSELFAGQDWTVIYKAFTEVNLNAYDFDTIRLAMKDYIQLNYPEDFNDWIESSEFVALIDLLAYLGQSLAFRMDIDARENILELARSRESVLRLARFLSYSPQRNRATNGLVKLTEVRATQDIFDSSGNNLNNQTIRWDDPNNVNWYEQFILVMNSIFIGTNKFGSPLKSLNIGGVTTEMYRLENIPVTAGNIPFSASINNTTYNFDLCNVDFDKTKLFTERYPDPQARFNLLYRNDGNGNASKNTGFFMFFKQGALSRTDFNLVDKVENRMIDVPVNFINESDVWVQSVNDNGMITDLWERVGYVPNNDIDKVLLSVENISYNSVSNDIRNIFQVITRDQDQISLRFSDGRFGTIPSGYIRVWHRQSAGALTIRPDEMRTINVSIPYQAADGKRYTFGMGFGLMETVSNGANAETEDDIKRNASGVWTTQARMVSGDDYNLLPASNNVGLKIKAVNRVYSGHSRFIDLNDPTGNYQNSNVFADDGSIYKEEAYSYFEIPFANNVTNAALVSNFVIPSLQTITLRDFVFNEWLNNASAYDFVFSGLPVTWDQSTNAIYSSTGRFMRNGSGVPVGTHAAAESTERFITPTSMVKFRNYGWTTVQTIDGTGADILTSGRGPIRLNEDVPTGDEILQVIPAFRRELSSTEYNTLINMLESKRTFGLGWDYDKQAWYTIDNSRIDLSEKYDYSTKGQYNDSTWIIKFEYSSLSWRLTTRGLRYVFESTKEVKFYVAEGQKAINTENGRVGIDTVNVLSTNYNPILANAAEWIEKKKYAQGDFVFVDTIVNGSVMRNYYECILGHTSGTTFVPYTATIDSSVTPPKAVLTEVWRSVAPSLGTDVVFDIDKVYTYDDGLQEPRRVCITFFDSDYDGQPDNPESFTEIVSNGTWIFHKRTDNIYGQTTYSVVNNIKAIASSSSIPVLEPGQIVYLFSDDKSTGTFYQNKLTRRGIPTLGKTSEIAPIPDQSLYRADIGRGQISFQWKHYASTDHRIDPAINNIIDIFVLTKEYNSQMDNWYKAGANSALVPIAPSELTIRSTFHDLEEYKMFSDQISWRPVKFKHLFGSSAVQELRAKFKVVKLANTTVSDGEIKARILTSIQDYFNVNNWDFGETFYFTELASFIHRQLVNAISSVVIVPIKESQAFGDLFEVRCNPDEMFFPSATVNDIEIIPSNTATSLRVK